jgi:hypothetical protein
MTRPTRLPPPRELPPVTFEAGRHALIVRRLSEGRWNVSVDGRLLEGQFGTQVDAWEAGVREADRLDRPAGR